MNPNKKNMCQSTTTLNHWQRKWTIFTAGEPWFLAFVYFDTYLLLYRNTVGGQVHQGWSIFWCQFKQMCCLRKGTAVASVSQYNQASVGWARKSSLIHIKDMLLALCRRPRKEVVNSEVLHKTGLGSRKNSKQKSDGLLWESVVVTNKHHQVEMCYLHPMENNFRSSCATCVLPKFRFSIW